MVPALSEWIYGIADLNLMTTKFGIVESLPDELDVPDILVSSALIDVRKTNVPVRLMNISVEDMVLYKGTKLAYLYEVEDIVKFVEAENDDKEFQNRLLSLCKVQAQAKENN